MNVGGSGINLSTGALPPVNSQDLAVVATTGRFLDTIGHPVSLNDLQNNLSSVTGDLQVPGTLQLGGVVKSSGSLTVNNVTTLGQAGVATSNVSCSSFNCSGVFVGNGAGSFANGLTVSGPLAVGGVAKAQGVQVPKTVQGLTPSQAATLTASCGSTVAVPVSYGLQFSKAPVVQCNAYNAGSTATPCAVLVVGVEAVTTTGFTAQVFNVAGTAFSGPLTLAWQASALS